MECVSVMRRLSLLAIVLTFLKNTKLNSLQIGKIRYEVAALVADL